MYTTLKNAGPISITLADHESEIEVGSSRGCAPDTVDLIWALAAATDMAVGVGEAAGVGDIVIGVGEAAGVGDATVDGVADADALGLVEPQAAIKVLIARSATAAALRLNTG